MVVTDPISDFVIRIKNALQRNKEDVIIPSSKMKVELARLLQEEGYISGYEVIEDNKQGILKIGLKYTEEGESVIREMKRVSKPGCRIYCNVSEVPRVIEGLGRAIISTSQGLLTDKECRKSNVGGEILIKIW